MSPLSGAITNETTIMVEVAAQRAIHSIAEAAKKETGMMEVCKRDAPVPQAVALLVGQEPMLLQTRGLILQAAGYLVHLASLEEASSEFNEADFDVVILCHSVAGADRARFTQLVRAARPLTRVVNIAHLLGDYDRISGATIEPDPARFLRGVEEALKA